MSRSSAQKSAISSIGKQKKIEQVPIFDPSKYATKNVSVDDVTKLKQCFDIFDYDKSGEVSGEELINAIKALGLQKDAQKILKIVSSQSDAQEMDFPAFLQIFGFSSDPNSQQSLQQLFQIFDKNSLGSFGIEQFAEICQEVGERFSPNQIEQMITYADKDGDGRINFEEFVDIVTKQYPTV